MPSPPLSRGEPSKNSRHPTSGEFTPQPRQKDPAFNTSVVYGAPTTSTNGSSSRSDNILKTPQGQLSGPVLRGVRSPISIPTSPNYFDLLYDEEEDPTSPTLPLPGKQAETRKRVTFAPSPHPQIEGHGPSTGRKEMDTLQRPPLQHQPTRQKKKQQQHAPPVTWDLPTRYNLGREPQEPRKIEGVLPAMSCLPGATIAALPCDQSIMSLRTVPGPDQLSSGSTSQPQGPALQVHTSSTSSPCPTLNTRGTTDPETKPTGSTTPLAPQANRLQKAS